MHKEIYYASIDSFNLLSKVERILDTLSNAVESVTFFANYLLLCKNSYFQKFRRVLIVLELDFSPKHIVKQINSSILR